MATQEPAIMFAESNAPTFSWRQYFVITDQRVAIVEMIPALWGGWKFRRITVQGPTDWPLTRDQIVAWKLRCAAYPPAMAPDLGDCGGRCRLPDGPRVVTATSVRGFPFPAEITKLPNFTDTSWGNDVVDSVGFCLNGQKFMIWIDAERPEDRTREWGWDGGFASTDPPRRYSLHRLNNQPPGPGEYDYSEEMDAPLYEGSSDEHLLAAIGALARGATPVTHETISADQLRGLLDHPAEHIRRAAQRVLCDPRPVDSDDIDTCCAAINRGPR